MYTCISSKTECGHLNGGKSKAVTYAFPPGYRENAEEEEVYMYDHFPHCKAHSYVKVGNYVKGGCWRQRNLQPAYLGETYPITDLALHNVIDLREIT
jgi:hypothetical protein